MGIDDKFLVRKGRDKINDFHLDCFFNKTVPVDKVYRAEIASVGAVGRNFCVENNISRL
jgi:hypothetical protein